MVKKVLIVGDSLAGGFPHLSFPAVLGKILPDWKFEANALGGDTLAGISSRLERLLTAYGPDVAIIEAGANDILLPFLEKRGGAWKRLARTMITRGRIPATEPSSFQALLERTLNNTQAKVEALAVTTIPCLGEDLSSPLNQLRKRYNAAISEAVQRNGALLADVGERYEEILSRAGKPSPYLLERFGDIFLDTLRTLTPRMAFQLSGRRGLVLTIDGVHPNPLGAKALAETVAEALRDFR